MNLSKEQNIAIQLLSKMDQADRNICITAALVEGYDSGETMSALVMATLTTLGFVHQCEYSNDKYSLSGWQKHCFSKMNSSIQKRLSDDFESIQEIQQLVKVMLGAELVEGDE